VFVMFLSVFGHVYGAEQSGNEVCVCVLSVYGRKKEKIKESKIFSVESPVICQKEIV
jgi:hypothetical protein